MREEAIYKYIQTNDKCVNNPLNTNDLIQLITSNEDNSLFIRQLVQSRNLFEQFYICIWFCILFLLSFRNYILEAVVKRKHPYKLFCTKLVSVETSPGDQI